MTLIIGSNGNIARRYKSILNYMGEKFIGVDINESDDLLNIKDIDRILICTPSETHTSIIKTVASLKKPILCEKPISFDLTEIIETMDYCDEQGAELAMVMQYKYLNPHIRALGSPSSYNYFNTGKDGLLWDCIQIIALAEGPVEIRNTSPVWSCQLNGQWLSLSDMDKAYVRMIDDWINDNYKMTKSFIYRCHQKVVDYNEKNINRCTG